MTVEEIRARVEEIANAVHDDERAHALEDDLYFDVLRAIAAGAENAQQLAEAAIETRQFEFQRWCA